MTRWSDPPPRPRLDRDLPAHQLLAGDVFRVPRADYRLLVEDATDRVQVLGRDCVNLLVRQLGPPGDPKDGTTRRLPLPLDAVVTLLDPGRADP
jgi:hypothetical protein